MHTVKSPRPAVPEPTNRANAAGDPRVWRVAAVAGAMVAIGLLVALLIPRTYYTGTNNILTRALIGELGSEQELCVPYQTLPAGTGVVRMGGSFKDGAAPTSVGVRFQTKDGLAIDTTVPSGRITPSVGLDIAIPRVERDLDGSLCLTPHGGAIVMVGMPDLPGLGPPPEIDRKVFKNRIALWYLPPAGEKRALLTQIPDMAERAALFRPGFVGPWTYWVLFGLGLPALALAAVALVARAAAGLPARVPRALAVWVIAFGCAGSFALVTPMFQAPDESEHFAYVEYVATTGNAIDNGQTDRLTYSMSEILALQGVYHGSVIETSDGRPPWRAADVEAYRARVAVEPDGHPRRDNGGGYATATSAHSPLFYALAAPAYLAAGRDVPTQLFAVRLVTSALIALAAMFAFLTVLEVLPGRPWAALLGGLVVAFQPMFSFMGGAVNNDAGIYAAAAAIAWLLVRALRRGLDWRLGIALGAVLAVAPLLKGTAYFVYPVALLALLGVLMRSRARPTLLGLAAVAGAWFALTLVWGQVAPVFGRDLVTGPNGSSTVGVLPLTDPLGYVNYLWQLFLPPLPGAEDIFVQRVPAFTIYVVRGWGAFGWYALLFPNWLFVVIGIALCAAVVLTISTLVRERAAARRLAWEILVIAALPVCVFLGVEAIYATPHARGPGPLGEQGRYIFPAAVGLSAWAVAACFGLGRRLAVPLGVSLLVVVIGLSAYGRLIELAGFYT